MCLLAMRYGQVSGLDSYPATCTLIFSASMNKSTGWTVSGSVKIRLGCTDPDAVRRIEEPEAVGRVDNLGRCAAEVELTLVADVTVGAGELSVNGPFAKGAA